jgi:hypothetical protein
MRKKIKFLHLTNLKLLSRKKESKQIIVIFSKVKHFCWGRPLQLQTKGHQKG